MSQDEPRADSISPAVNMIVGDLARHEAWARWRLAPLDKKIVEIEIIADPERFRTLHVATGTT